jgi:Zn-dependent M28 family amino/carboxypeptidase
MIKRPFYVFLVGSLFLGLLSCKHLPGEKSEEDQKENKVVEIQIPQFNADSAFKFVAEQVAFGPRVPNTIAHEECALYLEQKMKTYTSKVMVQEFQQRAYDGTVLNGKNIISQFNPTAKKRILLAAHWDSRPFADHDPDEANHHTHIDGANDGASGVGILIEIARLMADQATNVGVDIVFFDLEDYGVPDFEDYSSNESWALGSQYWSRNPMPVNYNATFGILLDMVGAENPVFKMEHYSMYYAPHIVKKVWKKAAEIGHGAYFLFEDGGIVMDDHIPVNEILKIPMIDIIHYDPSTESGFFPHWHTVHDNLENIDPATLGIVGEVVTQTIYSE